MQAAEPKKSAAKASEERGTSAAARKTEDEADGQGACLSRSAQSAPARTR
jgi:hypothetical protein